MEEHSDHRALKFAIIRRNLADVVAELQARSCSIEGSEADLKERMLQKLLKQVPALDMRMPWYAINEVRREDQLLIDLVEPQQPGAARAPASAAVQSPALPAVMRTGSQSSSPSSEKMRGLNRVPSAAPKCSTRRSTKMCMQMSIDCMG